MVWGPCGGVRPGGGCEVEPERTCDFVSTPVAYPPGVPGGRPAGPPAVVDGSRPLVITDFHVRPRDGGSLRRVAQALRDKCDAVLVADHGARRGDFPPTYVAARLVELGIRPWVTLSCRDRNAAALDAECAALADLGVAGVHCVTGDWVTGDRVTGGGRAAGGAPVFDLDALRLVERAAGHGLAVSVAASPSAPPVEDRPRRLAAKARAGATFCFVNHCGGPAVVARFVSEAIDAGAGIGFLACVPAISDPASAAALAALPGLVLDAQVVTRVAGSGGDAESGIRAAAEEAAAMLSIPGVVGVNLSGAASNASESESAAMMAELGNRIKRRALERERR